ncbi:MAG: hypothetical protein ACK5PU_03920, partial [bacterium]
TVSSSQRACRRVPAGRSRVPPRPAATRSDRRHGAPLLSAAPGALTPLSGISSAPRITPGISMRPMACRALRWNWGAMR